MIDLRHKPTLSGEKVLLRPFKVDKDFPYIKECLTDTEVINTHWAMGEKPRIRYGGDSTNGRLCI